MPFYKYPRPAVTVDVVLLSGKKEAQEVLLIQRKNEPFGDCWAFPGGFVDKHESLKNAAYRELKEETSIDGLDLIQFRAYGDPGRDPRGDTVSIVYWARVQSSEISATAHDDAKDVRWFSLKSLPKLAFDHQRILEDILTFIEKDSVKKTEPRRAI